MESQRTYFKLYLYDFVEKQADNCYWEERDWVPSGDFSSVRKAYDWYAKFGRKVIFQLYEILLDHPHTDPRDVTEQMTELME